MPTQKRRSTHSCKRQRSRCRTHYRWISKGGTSTTGAADRYRSTSLRWYQPQATSNQSSSRWERRRCDTTWMAISIPRYLFRQFVYLQTWSRHHIVEYKRYLAENSNSEQPAISGLNKSIDILFDILNWLMSIDPFLLWFSFTFWIFGWILFD